MYKYLLFDLDETLLNFKKAEAAAITQVLKKYGILADEGIVSTYSQINESCWKRFEKGEIARDEIYSCRVALLGEKLGVTFNAEEFSREYFAVLSHQGHTFKYSLTLLKEIKKRGYIIAAVTNGALIAQTGRIVASGLSGFFGGGIFISEKVGYKKPQAEFFKYVLRALGDPPGNQVLVLGDSVSSDIMGAISAGLDCCYVDLSKKGCPDNIHPTYKVTALEDIISTCRL